VASINPGCKRCDLWRTAGTVCLAGEGPQNADIVVIGEAPGKEEARTGRPFVGESGQVLRKELKKNDLDSVYITNIVKCRPPKNRTPTLAEVKACKPYLEEELEKIDPEFVLTLGGTATKALFRGKAKITEVHGEIIENEKVNYIGMPTFHPAYTLRDPSKLPGFQRDIQRLAEVYYGEDEDSTVMWNIVRRGNLDVFIKEFAAAPDFAFDLETSGLFPFDGKGYITAVGICLPQEAWIIPGFMHPDYQRYSHSPFIHGDALVKLIKLLCHIARVSNKKISAWNGIFDNGWLKSVVGDSFRLEFDAMLAAHVLNENTANDLTSNSRTFLHASEYDIPLDYKIGKHTKPAVNYKYCAQDCTYTHNLTHIFQGDLKKDQALVRLFHRLVMPAARVMEVVESNGLTIDREKMHEVTLDYLSKQKRLEVALNQLAGRTVNWNSPQQVATVIYEDYGLHCTLMTDKGNPSTSEEALLDLKGKHQVVDTLIEYRETAKILSSYLRGYQKFRVGSKLHFSYKLHGTVTGRYACALHSIPKKKEIRSIVTAPRGWKFVQVDLSQAELRVAAHLSGDPELRRCFLEDIDIHWATMLNTIRIGGGEYAGQLKETAYKLDKRVRSFSDAVNVMFAAGPEAAIAIWGGWSNVRRNAKAQNFGFLYGMYEKRFIMTAKKDYDWAPTFREAKDARRNFFNLYRGLLKWHVKQIKLAHLNGHVRDMFGRIRRLPGIHSKEWSIKKEAERIAINSPVQSTVGNWKSAALIEIHETMDGSFCRLVGEHHDALFMEVRSDSTDRVLPQVLDIMEKPKLLREFNVKLSVPMRADAEIGPWSAGVKYIRPEDR